MMKYLNTTNTNCKITLQRYDFYETNKIFSGKFTQIQQRTNFIKVNNTSR